MAITVPHKTILPQPQSVRHMTVNAVTLHIQ